MPGLTAKARTVVIGSSLLLVLWLGIGWHFAFQHGYLDEDSCSTPTENATAVVLGPINYAESGSAWGMCNVPNVAQ